MPRKSTLQADKGPFRGPEGSTSGQRTLAYNLGGQSPLPSIEGPKLNAFELRKSQIEFLNLLSTHPTNATGSGGHAHVFRVRIEGHVYALKMFKFFDLGRARDDQYPFWNTGVDSETFTLQTDPFFAECRAYGRIEEIKQEHRKTNRFRRLPSLAASCYGFLAVPATMEQYLAEKFGIQREWARPTAQYDLPPDQRDPFRALAKEYIAGTNVVLTPKTMLRDMRILRDAGLFQRDVFARNYLDGLLLDFSVAWTRPHWIFQVMDQKNINMRTDADLYNFDIMLKQEKPKSKVRALGDPRKSYKLRERERVKRST